MNLKKINLSKYFISLAFLFPLIIVNADNHAPIIQPGAPGNPSKILDGNYGNHFISIRDEIKDFINQFVNKYYE